MIRTLLALLVAAATCFALALAQPSGREVAAAQAASRHAARTPRPALSLAAARKPIGQFLASAAQVTGLPPTGEIGACRRRSARVIDCAISVPGRTTGVMRAVLVGTRHARVQLFVLRTSVAG
jgi:hypothetical protein